MASGNWIRHAAITHILAVLGELVADGKLDAVTADPRSVERSTTRRVAYVRGGDDDRDIETHDVQLSATILIRLYGTQSATEGVSLALERLIAEVRDKIDARKMDFHELDPPMQVESDSVTDDPAFSSELDLSATTLAVRIVAH